MIRVIIDKLKDSVWWSMGWGLPPSEHKMQGQSTNDVHTSQYTYKQTKTISDCVTLIANGVSLALLTCKLFIIIIIIGKQARHSQGYHNKKSGIFVCLLYNYNVWTYICHFVLWPSRIFVLARCLTPSQTSLNRIFWFSDHYPHHPRNWTVYRFEFFCGCS